MYDFFFVVYVLIVDVLEWGFFIEDKLKEFCVLKIKLYIIYFLNVIIIIGKIDYFSY